jgi:hypothetical protein
MQKWGTRTILIESGEYDPFNDKERQYVRKLNFIAILSALKAISEHTYMNIKEDEYWRIPEIKDAKMFHVIIRNALLFLSGKYFKIDIGIHFNEIPNDNTFLIQSEIYDIGDLSFYHAYQEFDANEAVVKDMNSNYIKLNIGDSANFVLEKNDKTVVKVENGTICID